MTDPSITAYLREAGKYPLLTKAQEIMLARQVQDWLSAENPTLIQARRGKRAQDKLIKCNLRLVVSIAKKYTQRLKHCEFLDLVQEGNIGLTNGIRKFDPERGYALSTYVYWWIRQGITRYLQTHDRIIKLPFNALSTLSKLSPWALEFSVKHGRAPSCEECSEYVGITPGKLKEYLLHSQDAFSLDIKTNKAAEQGKETTTLLDLVSDQNQADPLEQLSVEMGSNFMLQLVNNLENTDKEVMEKYYGLVDGVPKTLTAIGAELGVSRERVRQRHANVILKLRLTSAGMRVS